MKTPGIRQRNLYEPKADKPFKVSRSGIEAYMNCARCFYLDRRLGVAQPAGFPFNLNSAVDALLKKEFDIYRAKGVAVLLFEGKAQRNYGAWSEPLPPKAYICV